MKIFVIIFMVVVMLLFTQSVKGDVDGNGFVNYNDIILVKNHILKINELKGLDLMRADVDKDGKINSTDYSWVIILRD